MSQVIFNSEDLLEQGRGLRFDIPQLGANVTGFVIRFSGKPFAYVNQCAHISVEMDWEQGHFFNITKDFIICATHGAMYRPNSGECVMGPCKGKQLRPLPVVEEAGKITIELNDV